MTDTLLHQLYKHDPKARLLKYPAELNSKPSKNWIHHLSPAIFKPKNKAECSRYLYNYWQRNTGERSTAKVYIAHDITVEEMLEKFALEIDWDDGWGDSNKDNEFFLTLSTLQVPDVVSVGWFHGSSLHTNLSNLGEALNNTLELSSSGIKVELRCKQIQIMPGEKVDVGSRIPAVHVYVARDHYHQALMKLDKIYSSKRKFGQPECKRFQFIPDTSSPCSTLQGNEEALATNDGLRDDQALHLKLLQIIYLTA
jgi:hypothetical protein